MIIAPHSQLWADDVHNANIGRPVANRRKRREKTRMAKGKPSKGTPKDKRLKRNRTRRK